MINSHRYYALICALKAFLLKMGVTQPQVSPTALHFTRGNFERSFLFFVVQCPVMMPMRAQRIFWAQRKIPVVLSFSVVRKMGYFTDD